MKNIITMKFGSALYGTEIETSDLDLKGVFIPKGRDIILQQTPSTQSYHSNTERNTKNTKDDIDTESFSLKRYFELLYQGQTIAFDMLFTPSQFWTSTATPEWLEIQANRDKLLHKKIGSFVGYCKNQAEKYSLRGSRMRALEYVLDQLSRCNPHDELGKAAGAIVLDRTKDEMWEHITMESQDAPHLSGGKLHFLVVCGKKAGWTSNVKFATDVFKNALSDYGARANAAKNADGVDWKAMYHAVRIAKEAEELLLTKNITFPRPEASLLLKIRKGELSYNEVSAIIEEGLVKLISAQEKSDLPMQSDKKFMDDMIYHFYLDSVEMDLVARRDEIDEAFRKATLKAGW